MSLLAEHSGEAGYRAVRGLAPIDGLVARLDRLGARPGGRLRTHGPPTPTQQAVMQVVDPDDLPFAPGFEEGPGADEPVDESGAGIRAALGRIAGALGRGLGWTGRAPASSGSPRR